MIICGIYKITSPTNKIYIGRSVDIYSRWNTYRKYKCKDQVKLYNSLKKHGFENHKFEIIHKCRENELNSFEWMYVFLYDTFNTKHGLNIRDGGGSNGKISEETKKKMSIAAKGKPKSKEAVEKMKNTKRGKPLSDKNKQGISLANKGRIVSTETREKISKANKGHKVSIETREKISKAFKGKPISEKARQSRVSRKLSESHKQHIKESLEKNRLKKLSE